MKSTIQGSTGGKGKGNGKEVPGAGMLNRILRGSVGQTWKVRGVRDKEMQERREVHGMEE